MEERRKVKKAAECCKKILNHINQAVKEAENRQRLKEYQRRLDLSSLKPNENPVVLEVKNLDLTKKKLIHEGPLSWKFTKDKAIDIYTLLLEDVLVLLQKQDDRLILKLHGKNLTSADSKQVFSPVIRLSTVLVRPVATDHKSFFVLSMSDNVAQIYELTAQTISDQRTWQRLITQCADFMKARLHSRDTALSQSDVERKANEIISNGLDKTKESCVTDVPCEESAISPVDRMRCAEEPEHPEEQEVDEAELEAFLDGQLAERLDQENLQNLQNQDSSNTHELNMSTSKAEDALCTLSMLRQLLNHMIRATEEPTAGAPREEPPAGAPREEPPAGAPREDTPAGAPREEPPAGAPREDTPAGAPREEPPAGAPREEPPAGAPREDTPAGAPREDTPAWTLSCAVSSGALGCPVSLAVLEQSPEAVETEVDPAQQCHHNGFVVLDLCNGPEDSAEDDVGIDMSKLLSSSSQAGGAGPNLSRQLMTHLRLLQANLHYLKEVEDKYRQLQQGLSDTTTDSDYTDSVI